MDTLALACDLMRYESVSSRSNVPVTDYAHELLEAMRFDVERCDYTDNRGVAKANLVAKIGQGKGGLAYFAHTDVVPADDWYDGEYGPFCPVTKDERLVGRGSCDMKGSLASFLTAMRSIASSDLKKPVYIICTADEETGHAGARHVVASSRYYREIVEGKTRAIIGEPTEMEVVYAHKGIYGFRATALGRAAHSSTADGVNANVTMIPFLNEMKAIHDMCQEAPKWQHQEFDPPTIGWNIGINDGNTAINVTAPRSVCTVSFRPMPGQKPCELLERAERKAKECGLEFNVLTRVDPLYVATESHYIKEVMECAGKRRPRTVSYGTDGGVFRDVCEKVVIGPGSIAQAHTSEEWVSLEQLERATDVYTKLIHRFCC